MPSAVKVMTEVLPYSAEPEPTYLSKPYSPAIIPLPSNAANVEIVLNYVPQQKQM